MYWISKTCSTGVLIVYERSQMGELRDALERNEAIFARKEDQLRKEIRDLQQVCKWINLKLTLPVMVNINCEIFFFFETFCCLNYIWYFFYLCFWLYRIFLNKHRGYYFCFQTLYLASIFFIWIFLSSNWCLMVIRQLIFLSQLCYCKANETISTSNKRQQVSCNVNISSWNPFV